MPLTRRSTVPDSVADKTPTAETLAAGDCELAARIRLGDAQAFETMFKAHYDALCRYTASYLGNRDAAEDVVQGVFVRMWEARAHWELHGPLRHYLCVAVRRRALSHLRHEAVRHRTAPFVALETAARAGAAGVDAEGEAEELRRRFERAVAALPPRTREAFVLSRGEGLRYDEVALRMGISPKTVGVHIGRSLALLRKAVLPALGAVVCLSRFL